MSAPTAPPSGRLAFPASSAQEQMWFLQQLVPGNPYYNVPLAFRLSGHLDTEALAAALTDVVTRHETLRTVFADSPDGLEQVVLDPAGVPLETVDAAGPEQPGAALAELTHRPFDLTTDPPLRAALLRLDAREHVLLLVIHHIAVDGWSLGVLSRELGLAYDARCGGRAPDLPELSIQYADWSEWQRERRAEAEAGLAYWRRQLAGAPAAVELPGDRPRDDRQSYMGAHVQLDLPDDLTDRLTAFCRERGVTRYVPLLAAYAAFLARHTGARDVVVGTPFAGRDDPQVQPLVGYFANVLPMRVGLHGDPSFAELVDRAAETARQARRHDDVRLETIVAELAPDRRGNRAPLVQTVFALQNFARPELAMTGLRTEHLLTAADSTRHDLEFHVQDSGGKLRLMVIYATELFDEPTVHRLARRWLRLLTAAIATPDVPFTRLDMLTEEERARLLTGMGSPLRSAPEPLSAVLARHVAERPGAAAVADGATVTSWGELSRRASAITARLSAAGCGPGAVLAVAAGADASGVGALLGALGCGATVVGLDPADPPARNRDLVRRSGATAVLTDAPGPWEVPVVALSEPDAADGVTTAPLAAHPEAKLLEWSARGPVTADVHALAAQTRLLVIAAGLDGAGSVSLSAPPGSPAFARAVLATLVAGDTLVLGGGEAVVVLAADDLPVAPGERTVRLGPAPDQPGADPERDARVALAPGIGPYALTVAGRAGMMPLFSVAVLDEAGQPSPWGVTGELWAAGGSGTVTGLPERPAPLDPGVTLRPTGHTARADADGRLASRGSTGAVVAGQWVDPAPVEDALLGLDSVRECRVEFRRGRDGVPRPVAYVVTSAGADRAHLAATATGMLPAGARPVSVVTLSVLPRTASGAVDTEALHRICVPDDDLIATWERRLAPAAADGEVAVVVADAPLPELERLHLGTAMSTSEQDEPGDASAGRPGAPKPQGRPSFAEGPPLRRLDEPDLAAALRRAASGTGDIVHIHADGTTERQPYAELATDASVLLGRMRRAGVRAGDIVVLQLGDTRAFLTGFWACVIGGFVAVPTAPPPAGHHAESAQATRLADAWENLAEPWILAPGQHREAIAELISRRTGRRPRIATVEPASGDRPDPAWHEPDPGDLVLLLLTSGSTGRPKAVQQRHRNLLTQIAAAHQAHGITAADRSFNWMPLDHVGGLVMTHLRDLAAGARQVIAPTSWVLEDPLRWLDAIDEYRATTSWAPNFAYGLVTERLAERSGSPGRDWDLSCLRLTINGGEAVVARVVRAFLTALAPYGLPGTAVRPSWGMSETCSAQASTVLTLDAGTADDGPVSCGRPFPGFAVRVVHDDGSLVPEGGVGRLQVRGDAVTSGYHRDEERTAEAFPAEGWFETGDLAFLRDGELHLTGRAKDTIIVNGVNLYAHDIEALVEDRTAVERSFTAAVAARAPGDTTDRLALFCCPQRGTDPARLAAEITGLVTRETGTAPAYLLLVAPEDIPKTEIGKIRRSALQQRLSAGDFDAALVRADLLLGNDRTLPNWFFRPAWQRAEPQRAPAGVRTGHTVILSDRGGVLAARVAELAGDLGARCTVSAAAPASLMDTADRIIDLRLYGAEPGPDGDDSPLTLLRALAAGRGTESRPLALTVVATSSCPGPDGVVAERAAGVPVLAAAGNELPWLTGRWIDADPTDPPEVTARLLADELRAPVSDPVVAYRAGTRYARRLEQLPAAMGTPPWRQGGHYLITGGLGGLVVETARHLLRTRRAAITLVGRSRPADVPERAAVLAGLQALGPVRYVTADITDADAVRETVAAACAAHGDALDGVLHLAGVLEERPLSEAGPEHWRRVLAAKTTGAAHLLDALADRPDTLFVAYSSVNGYFGGAGAAAYSAANAYLDALVAHRRAAGGRAHSIAWSMWDEVGMSRGYGRKQLTRAGGYLTLGVREGVRSLDVALAHDEPHVLVGLDPRVPAIAAQRTGTAHPRQRLTAHLVATRPPVPAENPVDAFGTPAPCAIILADTLPRHEDGTVDRRRLETGTSSIVDGPEAEAPSGEAERLMAELWCAVLDTDRVGRHDNFFDIGGRSLLATRLVSRVREAFGADLNIADLFEHPTVASLTARLGRGHSSAPFDVHLPLRPAGDGTPLFCFHPGGGIAWPYAALLAHLDERIPVHGIQARGLTDPAALPASVADMAADYTEQIRRIRPHGPYALLGWSLGGLVAHAVAERLQRAGERVELLALLDAYPLAQAEVAALPPLEELESTLLGLLLDGAGVAPADDRQRPGRAAAIAALRGSDSALAHLDEATLGRMVQVMRHNTALVAGHTPGTVDGDVVLFTATRSHTSGAPAPVQRWRPYVTGTVVDHPIDCLHQEMLRPAHLPAVASVVGARLTGEGKPLG